MTSLDRQFVRIATEFQSTIDTNDILYKQKLWDEDEVILYAQKQDWTLKRKPERNLRIACSNGILSMTKR